MKHFFKLHNMQLHSTTKALFIILLILHASIHLLGFYEAVILEAFEYIEKIIFKTTPVLWLCAAILFLLSAYLILLGKDFWWMSCSISVLISQYLIFSNWESAKFGTIVNLLIMMGAILAYATWHFARKYENEVINGLKYTFSFPDSILTESDIQHLPAPVAKYIIYSGAIGKPKVKNFKVEFSGRIRKDEQSEWMPFTSEQYNFMNTSTRLFFMKATMKHLPVAGFHSYENGSAFMDIRLLSLFKVQYQTGKEMNVAETVTFFNDMCCMAPATLIDERIQWTEIDGTCVKAAFTINKITINAWLYFNEKGELVNFVSNDRYALSENNTMVQVPWSTPMKDYKEFNGYKIIGYADAIYTYPKGKFCYGNFSVINIEYNCANYKTKSVERKNKKGMQDNRLVELNNPADTQDHYR